MEKKKQTGNKVVDINLTLGFPGGPVVKNLPAHRFDLWSRNIPDSVRQLNPCMTTKSMCHSYCPRACAPKQEKPLQREACAPQLESRLSFLQLEKASTQQ